MTDEQEKHLGHIKNLFVTEVDAKYRAGQKEHGGNLYNLSTLELLDNAIEEAIDQYVYLVTIRDKLIGDD